MTQRKNNLSADRPVESIVPSCLHSLPSDVDDMDQGHRLGNLTLTHAWLDAMDPATCR